jgi:hypothetical protein
MNTAISLRSAILEDDETLPLAISAAITVEEDRYVMSVIPDAVDAPPVPF